MTEYEMTDLDMEELLEQMQPKPLIMLQCGMPSTVQESANIAWKGLGEKMGFDYMTVKPSSKGEYFFHATPTVEK